MRYEGNIYRPPGEWKSYLLQCTIGCSNNSCTYCGMYKDKQFRVRPLDDILMDIKMAKIYYGGTTRRVFLCDGDAIVMKQEELLAILDRMRESFPDLEKVTTYAGPRSTLTKSVSQLKELCDHGLKRAYLGMETGSDALLRQVNKGVSAEEMLEAGLRLREAGIDLWVMVLIGLGGKEGSEEHIRATAEMLNQMKPRHISAMTLQVVPGTPLYDDVQTGKFVPLSPMEMLAETKALLEQLDYGPIHFTSDHASNYLPLKGTLPDDAPGMITAIDDALQGQRSLRPEWLRGL